MSGKNQVTLTFAGDSDQLERSFADVGSAADEMADDVGKASKQIGRSSEAFDKVGEGSDVMERRARGLSDTISGTQDTMQGWSSLMKGDVSGGLMQMGMGVADLAGGVSDLIAPLAGQVTAWVSGHAAMAAATISSAAAQVGSWIMLGVSSLAAAAQVALAWLISIGPILIVAAAVIGLGVLIYKNWDTIKRWTMEAWSAVSNFVRGGIDDVIGFVKGIPGAVGSALGKLADVFLKPFRDAFDGIRALWNSTLGGRSLHIPGIPGIWSGVDFTIPKLATGGIVTQPTIALIGEAGPEAVVPLSHGSGFAGGGSTVLEIRSSGNPLDDLIAEIMRRVVRTRGGVSAVFSS